MVENDQMVGQTTPTPNKNVMQYFYESQWPQV